MLLNRYAAQVVNPWYAHENISIVTTKSGKSRDLPQICYRDPRFQELMRRVALAE